MISDSDKRHSNQVDTWISKNANGLPAEKLVPLFSEAIWAIRKRALATLSEVTFDAIFDRVLWSSQKEHPFLSNLKIGSPVALDALTAQKEDLSRDEIQEAFRFLLIELLSLLGNLTADILTRPLHRELSKVTAEQAQKKPKNAPRALRSVKGGSEGGNL